MHGFRISVAEILGRPTASRDIRVLAPLAEVGNALARLTDGPVAASLRADSVVEGILVTGKARADARLECARCLTAFASQVAVEVCELFSGPGHEAPEDGYRVSGTEIDLEPMLRDGIVLSLPLKPLCRDDCAGLCASCGIDLNQGACTCTQVTTDPRWAPLEALRDRLES
ncbi:MAG: DUF177 domain-containing protein [Actinomycetota bacterium]